jgi:hypothetical protein
VKTLFKITAFLLLALWLPATNHCDFEAADIGGLGSGDHCPLACGDTCESDACSVVEGEAYSRAFDIRKAIAPSQSVGFCLLSMLALPSRAEPPPAIGTGDTPEQEALLCTWSFVRRAVAPACAPNGVV